MEITPIRSDADHRTALAEIERLWDAEPGTPEADRLDILATLVERYEDRHHPIPKADPIELIRFVMEQRGAGQKDFAALIGSRSHASEVLKRKRPLTLEMIRVLHRAWRIPAELLIEPYELAA